MISIYNGRTRTLSGSQDEAWAKFNVSLRSRIRDFKQGTNLNPWAVFTVLALHANADGWSFPSTELLKEETGLSTDAAITSALSHLRSLKIDGKRILDHYRIKDKDHRWGKSYYRIFPEADEAVPPVPDLIPWNPEPPPGMPGVAIPSVAIRGDSLSRTSLEEDNSNTLPDSPEGAPVSEDSLGLDDPNQPTQNDIPPQSKQSVSSGSKPEEKTPTPVALAPSPSARTQALQTSILAAASQSTQAMVNTIQGAPTTPTMPMSLHQKQRTAAPVENQGQLPVETKQEAPTTVLEAVPDHVWITSSALGSKRHLAKSEKGHALCGGKVSNRVSNGEPTGEHLPCEECLGIARKPKVKIKAKAYGDLRILDAIVEVSWGIKPTDEDKSALEGGRCGMIRQRLVAHVLKKRKVDDLDEATIDQLVGHIHKFGKWFDIECDGCDRPKDPVKFMERWIQYTRSGGAVKESKDDEWMPEMV